MKRGPRSDLGQKRYEKCSLFKSCSLKLLYKQYHMQVDANIKAAHRQCERHTAQWSCFKRHTADASATPLNAVASSGTPHMPAAHR